uniref:Strictosidine synthase conserved region domain-containing protein n=1 Tax=Acrobeloides nanus TaxID=290746 RepID=A0A914D2K3_9BILA
MTQLTYGKIITIGLIGLVFGMYLSSYNFEPQIFIWDVAPELTSNDALKDAKILLKSKISAPESVVVEKNVIYTGSASDGNFFKIVDEQIEKTINNPFGSGAIFGLRRLNKTDFVAADMINGILVVNFETGNIRHLIPSGKEIHNFKISMTNDIDIIDEDTIIFTDTCSKWDFSKLGYCFFEHIPNGRVFKYQISTNKLELLIDELYFPNGLQILPDRKSILIGELWAARITQLYIEGPKKNERKIFADNLPGFSDNIRLSTHGTIYVAMAGVRQPTATSYLETIGNFPAIRKVFMQFLPEIFLKIWVFLQYSIQHGLVLEYDTNGILIRTLQDPTGVVNRISHVADDGEFLYLGSYINDFIAKIPKKNIA